MLLEKVSVAEFHRGSRHILFSENHHPELNLHVFDFLHADINLKAGLQATRGRTPHGIAPDKKTPSWRGYARLLMLPTRWISGLRAKLSSYSRIQKLNLTDCCMGFEKITLYANRVDYWTIVLMARFPLLQPNATHPTGPVSNGVTRRQPLTLSLNGINVSELTK